MIRLGFRPGTDDLEAVLDRSRFARAVVVDGPIDRVYDAVDSVRTVGAPEAGLPAGFYWLDGIDSPLLMQVESGPSTGDSDELELDVWDDAADHPLAEALRWGEYLWDIGVPVPAPKFGVGDCALTVPGDADVEIKSRTFDHVVKERFTRR